MVDESSCTIPDFGCVIERGHLLRMAGAQRPRLIVISAPSGYGKSVFASQFAAYPMRFDVAYWVPMYDSDVRAEEWLSGIAAAVQRKTDGLTTESDGPIPLSPTHQDSDAMLRVVAGLAEHSGKAVVLVVDGVNRIDDSGAFEDMADLLARSTSASSCLVVTCRHVTGVAHTPFSSRVWFVDERDLRFDVSEVRDLVTASAQDGCREDSLADGLMERFGGHPGLTSLMLKHRCIDDSICPPGDLIWYTARLVEQQPEEAIPALYCASLLREGRASELEGCLQRASVPAADWQLLQSLAPLLSAGESRVGGPMAFRVHAVLSEVLRKRGPERLGEEKAAQLRASVLGYLFYVGDYARAHGVLVSECPREEVASWCEAHGSGLLRCVGPAAVERCLVRVSPSQMAASAKLLLLRAAALREYERVEEAAANAALACRIAEIDGTREDLLTATLLVARLALDGTDLQRARGALEQLDDMLDGRTDAAVACVYHAYRALLATYECRAVEISSHLASAVELLSEVEEGTQEAVMAANCIAGIEGQLLGRWNRASALCARVSAWPKLPPLQALVSRANMAVCHLETGCMAEAASVVSGVLEDARVAGLSTLEAYALDTWAHASWFTDESLSRAAFDRSQQILTEHGDAAAVASALALRSLLVRSAGLHEESLMLAESAVAAVLEKGAWMRAVGLQAEVEVAASLLALGDRWGATRIIKRISADIGEIGAQGLAMCADLISAESERQAGNVSSACVRLSRHSSYIMSGAANLRLAMYVQSFPGLLSILGSSVGPDVLPLRMLRLLKAEVVESALSSQEAVALLSHEHRIVIGVRALGRADFLETDPGSANGSVEQGRSSVVRVFGGLHVETSAGIVAEEHWRKRKARLVFAMLVLSQGQDLSRDVIIERLWPDMDPERAKRNFYVTWSAMKRALSCGATSRVGDHLVQCVGGVCRLRPEVRSDLDDFDDAIRRLRTAREIPDPAGVIESANEVVSLYRGDLLSGDLYDQWFADVRERVRQDFCDALMVASQVAESAQQSDAAIGFLRKVSLVDPWREDAYQVAMRCQMHAGQRSRAIETYMLCRSKLVDDLGIDPSIETTRIYQAVLAMESEAPA